MLNKKPMYADIAASLRGSIIAGTLAPGAQLPTQRELAEQRHVTLGTISRAYAELLREGLIETVTGRGSFVRSFGVARSAIDSASREIDLRANRPPLRAMSADFINVFGPRLERLDDCLAVHQINLHDDPHKHAAAGQWLRQYHRLSSPFRTVLCSGAQHALVVALMLRCRAGDTIVTERTTYLGLIAAAKSLRLNVVGLDTDAHGILPESFEKVARVVKPKALVCTPNFHSPTTASLSMERRRRIAQIARSKGIFIIEDDVYGALADGQATPIYDLAPESTILLTSFSKLIAPGVRAGLACVPEDLFETAQEVVFAMGWNIDPISWTAVARWIEDGSLARILREFKEVLRMRFELAQAILASTAMVGDPCCPHIWIPLPDSASLSDIVSRAQEAGVRILGSDTFAIDQHRVQAGVRISLIAAPGLPELERALTVIKNVFAQATTARGAIS